MTELTSACSLISSPLTSGTATVTLRANNGSPVSIRTFAGVRFRAPRFNASRVTPGFSSRLLMVTVTGSVGALTAPVVSSAPVKAAGAERLSSTLKRRNSQDPSGKETRSLVAPPAMRKTGS